jgi:carbamoyl-phosphate synthase large subunit
MSTAKAAQAGAQRPVMIVPGGAFQIPLIRAAKARGYLVICADRRPDCDAAAVADEFHPLGLDQRDQLLALARTRRVQGVLTDQTDSGVATAAWLSTQLGLRGIGSESAALYTRKPLMRSFSRQAGFPAPTCHVCRDVAEATRAATELGYPVVVKPPAAQASKGVSRVAGPDALAVAVASAAAFSDDGTVLVETFVAGPEYTVEGFRTTDGHRTLAISSKLHYPHCPTVACALRYAPWSWSEPLTQLERQHDRWVDASGLPLGMTHAEYRWSQGRFYQIEVAARGGGSGIASSIVPWVSGIDYQEWLLDALVEQAPVPRDPRRVERCALLEFLALPDGVVRAIEGVDAARGLPGVHELVINCQAGTRIGPPADDNSRPGRFILLTDSQAELDECRRNLLATLRVTVAA